MVDVKNATSCKELKLLSNKQFVYCHNTTCRVCTFTNETSLYCRLLNNKIYAHAFTSIAINYIHPKLITRYIDTSMNKAVTRASILSFNIEDTSKELTCKQFTYDPKTISQQVTLGSLVFGNYVYFIGTSNQIIDQLEGIDPFAYSATSNQLVVKITRVHATDDSVNFSSRTDLTLDCRNDRRVPLTLVSRVYFDYTQNELWFTMHMFNGDYQICKFNIHRVATKMDDIAAICSSAPTARLTSDCKNLTESGYPEHCYIMARKSSIDQWKACSDLVSRKDNIDKWNSSHFGWFEYFKPFWQNPIDSTFSYEQSSGKFSYINWKILEVQSKGDFDHTLQIAATLGFSRKVAIYKNYLCYAEGASVRIDPISCEAFYNQCDSLEEGTLGPPGCIKCPHEENVVTMYQDNYTCKRPITGECPAVPIQTLVSSTPKQSKFPSTKASTKLLLEPEQTLNTSSIQVITWKGSNWITISVFAGTIFILVLLAGFIVQNRRNVKRQNSSVNKRRSDFAQYSQHLLASSQNSDATVTTEMLISSVTSSSSRFSSEYEHLFEKIDDNIKIEISHLRLKDTIGEGNFGVVLSGTYDAPDGDIIKVACKVLRKGESVKAFLDEGLTMRKFQHARVIPFIGIAFANNTVPIIITKFMPNGNLLTYLQNKTNTISAEEIQKFAMQIAKGMEYLHLKKFIHRDLAARNCMLDYKMKIKIGDFGLARQCNDQNMYLSCNTPDMSFAWASIEALEFWMFTLKFDIWSYGVVLWELMSRGERPYSEYTPSGLLTFLKQGKRLDNPADCPEEFYTSIMMPCWNEDMNMRPSFTELIKLLTCFTRE